MSEGFTVVLNDLDVSNVDSSGVSWRLIQNDGWDGSPASTLAPVQKTRAPGAWLSPRQLTPRIITPGGFLEGPDADTTRDAVDRLNDAVSLDEFRYSVTQGSLTRWVTAYRQDDTLPVYVTDTLVQWSAQIVAVDPRKVTADLTADTGLPSSSGGLTIPFTIPFVLGTAVSSGVCSLTNPGNETGRVTLRITGPIVGPVVTHVGSGRTLVFSSDLALAADEWLDVDMEAQTVLANGQSSRNTAVVSRGWSGFDPGVNIWAVSAVSGTGHFYFTATPSWK